MGKKTLFIVLLGIGLTALVGIEASEGAVCKYYVNGACKFWSGSVECGIGASGLGNVANDCVALACTVTGTGMWAVVCGNPGSNDWPSPGINVAEFDGILGGMALLDQDDVDRNGRAYLTVTAEAEPGLLEALREAGACPNSNWSVIDAVPCTMTVRDVQLENGCVTADAWYDCALPECATLAWDPNTQKFERRQYECTQTSKNTYKIPVECY